MNGYRHKIYTEKKEVEGKIAKAREINSLCCVLRECVLRKKRHTREEREREMER